MRTPPNTPLAPSTEQFLLFINLFRIDDLPLRLKRKFKSIACLMPA